MLINDAQITGSLTVNASSSFQNIIVSGNILPDTTNIRNLGSVDKYFKEIYVSTGSINFVDSGSVKSTISSAPGGGIQIGSVVITTSSIAFVDSTGSVTQNVAQSSSVGPISDYATSASFNSYTSSTNEVLSSLQTTSASVNVSVSAINTFTSSTSARVSSIETVSASNLSRLGTIETFTSSTSARLNSIENVSSSNLSRLSSLENKTGSLATTGSNTFVGTQVITGSLYITTDLIVQGSSSIQNITGSAINIGTNKVILNTDNPAVRFGGISVIDSGSTGLTGSILWDSTNNNWLYQNPSGSSYVSAKFISGPQSQTLGSESGLVTNFLVKAVGDDHISSSAIFDNGSTVSIKSNAEVTGSLKITSTVNATNLVGIWSGSGQLPAGIFSGSAQLPAGTVSGSSQISLSGFSTTNLSEGTNLYYTDARVKTKLNAETVISGSGQVAIASTSGFGTYINQALLTTSSPTFSTVTATLSGNASTATNSSQLGGYSLDGATSVATRIFNNKGQTHSTYTNFNTAMTPGPNYIQGPTNGPTGTAGGQWYGIMFGLGSDYGTTTGTAGHYASQLYYSRIGQDSNQYLWARDMESGTWGSWRKLYSGYADSAGSVTNGVYTTGDQTIGGTKTFSNKIIVGTFPNSTTNTGEAWFGRASDRNQGTYTIQLGGNSASNRQFEVVDYAWSVVLFSVSSGGTATASGDVVAYSDRRVKENIVTITDPLDKLLRLRGVSYNRTDLDDKCTKIGFIAQEVKDVLPEVVTYNKEQDRYGISYGNMSALLVEAIKEQQIKIDNLTVEIENLKKQKGL